jgi:hypothetical protein
MLGYECLCLVAQLNVNTGINVRRQNKRRTLPFWTSLDGKNPGHRRVIGSVATQGV